ncbi:hypothetical protein BGZ82_003943 [Podila clonocystis]|nr:hypothetical protein BGZ82_003943 [Podila clonocystis]
MINCVDDLKSCLSHYGVVERASVIRNKVTGISQRYGFVTFQDMSSALSLFRASRRHAISVTFTPRKPDKPLGPRKPNQRLLKMLQ